MFQETSGVKTAWGCIYQHSYASTQTLYNNCKQFQLTPNRYMSDANRSVEECQTVSAFS